MPLPKDPDYDPASNQRWGLEDQMLLHVYQLFLHRGVGKTEIYHIGRSTRSWKEALTRLEELAEKGVPIAVKALEFYLRDRFIKKCSSNNGPPKPPE